MGRRHRGIDALYNVWYILARSHRLTHNPPSEVRTRVELDKVESFVMQAEELRALQAPLKEKYRETPEAALITLTARGQIGEGVTCRIETGRTLIEAGLHPATGGDGLSLCSGDLLLEALVACAGVTLNAVATAIEVELRGGTVAAEGDLDFRGTLGVARDVPVGFQRIRLHFDLETDALPDKIATLIRLTERYCVVYQTLCQSPAVVVSHTIQKRNVE